MKYPCKFFDGLTSKPHLGQLEIVDKVKIILYLPEHTLHFRFDEISEFEYQGNETTTIKIGNKFPYQYIEVKSKDVVVATSKYTALTDRLHTSTATVNKNMLAGLIVASVLFIILFIVYGIPELGEQIAVRLPKDVEESIGRSVKEQSIKGQSIDKEKSDVVTRMANKYLSDEYDFEVFVVEDSIVNAFALPGGTIVVYTGILSKIKTPEELMALLAHEATHINHRHTMKNIGRSLANYVFFSWVIGDAAGLSSVIVDNYEKFSGLAYSRALEKDADMSGLELLRKNQIGTKGMLDLMQTLKKSSEGHEHGQKEFFTTHPLTDTRIAYVKEAIAKDKRSETNAELKSFWEELNK